MAQCDTDAEKKQERLSRCPFSTWRNGPQRFKDKAWNNGRLEPPFVTKEHLAGRADAELTLFRNPYRGLPSSLHDSAGRPSLAFPLLKLGHGDWISPYRASPRGSGLGRVRPGARVDQSAGSPLPWAGAVASFMSDGSRRTSDSAPARRVERWLLLGCSYTQGLGRTDQETFGWRLQSMFPDVLLTNFGTGGYGTYDKRAGIPLLRDVRAADGRWTVDAWARSTDA